MTQFSTTIDGTAVTFDDALVARYDRPGPRYTSYPTAPQWKTPIDSAGYVDILQRSNAAARPLSLYCHLPFCAEHCTFCGCNVVITKQRAITMPYFHSLHREISQVGVQTDRARPVVQLHLGGGTPTYSTPEQLAALSEHLRATFTFSPDAEIGVEADPRVTTYSHLEALRRCGWNRLSFGVQDFTPAVQAAINRHQSVEQTRALVDAGRALGYESINIDLIYGLPHQTIDDFARTVDTVLALSPDRVACYSFAYVPWLKAQQRRSIDPATLPDPTIKLQIWCRTIEQFSRAGYQMIGFDHFAKPTDEMTRARDTGTLWRNFQGYTTKSGTDLLAFGITGISDVDHHYIQNIKTLPAYHQHAAAGTLPVERACHLTPTDIERRRLIRYLLCHHALPQAFVQRTTGTTLNAYLPTLAAALAPMVQDGLATLDESGLHLTPRGRLFARNVAMCFDEYLESSQDAPQYSKTI